MHHLIRGIQRGRNVLMVGPTGTGKTLCWREAVHFLGLPHENIDGKEGLLDLDFVGAIVPTEDGRKVWVDGPLTRAMRRAAGERVVLWIDELACIPQKHLNLLKGLLNPRSERELRLQGIKIEGRSALDQYYLLELPMTSKRVTCPAENLQIVAACNLGRDYAVYGLDAALTRRFEIQLDFDFLPAQQEAAVLVARTGIEEGVAHVMAQVAARTRELYATAELPAPLDTASLLVWAEEVAARWERPTLAQLIAAARITWLARVAGRDHRGRINDGNAMAVEDVIRDIWAAHMPEGR